jgi:hypothetical protein
MSGNGNQFFELLVQQEYKILANRNFARAGGASVMLNV